MVRPAHSLDVLLAECNAVAPGRSKASDGWLGDADHQTRPSRHNPNDFGVVCARDITNDPAAGMPVHVLARAMVAPDRTVEPPEDLEYIISDRQVARRTGGWLWKPYTGKSPHTLHAHFAVGRGPDSEPRPPYDGTATWHVAVLLNPEPQLEDDDTMDYIITDPASRAGLLREDTFLSLNGSGLKALRAVAEDNPTKLVEFQVDAEQFDKFRRDAAARVLFRLNDQASANDRQAFTDAIAAALPS